MVSTHPLWHDYPNLSQNLNQVEAVINQHIRIKNKKIEAQIRRVAENSGKMLRPVYALLCSQIGPDYDEEKAIAIAAALETLHMATLVHDDVIDEADLRRGQETLHAKKDNRYAIYAGDYLFSICFTILANHTNSVSMLEYNARSMEKVLIGELDQLESRYTSPKSIKRYLARISGKTAQLFALSCYTGAVESNASKRQTRLAYNAGHYIGMAFQIIDDILDYQANDNTLGKPAMADAKNGIYTLPLIYSYQNHATEIDALLTKQTLTSEDLHDLQALIDQADGLSKALQLAKRYTKKALSTIDKLPNGEYKAILKSITEKMLARTM